MLFISLESEGLPHWRKITKIDRTAHILTNTLPFILGIVSIYSLVSIFHYETTLANEKEKTIPETIKTKYNITLTEKQQKELSRLIDEKNYGNKIYSTGSTTINGKQIIAVWENNQIYLLEFKNGQFVEIQN